MRFSRVDSPALLQFFSFRNAFQAATRGCSSCVKGQAESLEFLNQKGLWRMTGGRKQLLKKEWLISRHTGFLQSIGQLGPRQAQASRRFGHVVAGIGQRLAVVIGFTAAAGTRRNG